MIFSPDFPAMILEPLRLRRHFLNRRSAETHELTSTPGEPKPMNYRHSYHAANFADVLKHITLTLCLRRLQEKEAPLCVVDAHGGAGLYDLNSEEAGKTGEWRRGVGLIWRQVGAPEDLAGYLDLIRADMERGLYPGSPLLIARRLRPQDRLIANELHEPTCDALRKTLQPYGNARTTRMDAYECIRAHVPPKERRGLVVIDPPFEEKDERQTLARQMREWKKRWATGVYLVWYPIKAHFPSAALREAAGELGLRRTWFVETLVLPRDNPETLNGCGLIVFNAPYAVPERMEELLPFLRRALNLHETASGWVTPDPDSKVERTDAVA
jgi:23S rRNA (adenine2030-N6)-methyltransferase